MTQDDSTAAPITVQEAGRRGGVKARDRMLAKDPDYYRKIGKKGGGVTKAMYGHEFYQNIGKKGGAKGGRATRDNHGPAFYQEIGAKGGAKVKALIAAGRAAASKAQG
jgi:uncharacterized protein